ncbi:caspase family protein [Streptomyces sp. NEAU-sy36]|uniref:caspase, EACC1-associated type n=1 Tax=unclassified Streptomyces TaxID=2593676 RepID=UPI0015D58FD6|nr:MULTISPECIES: DnaJ C-terminal domain-containing protein [unclassified Streptomyces]QLJ02941.1 caspase family protein [Streptomyces sp. NEAU-sy36]
MTDSPLGPGRRDALLIATGTYDDRALSALRSPAQDCVALAEVLADPGIGAFHTEQLRDTSAHQAMRVIERFFQNRSRNDLLLVHISCHGIKDDDGLLYFAARDTDRDLPASTAVPAAFLRDCMDRCRARTIVVLLDCCYSGAFLPGTKGDDRIHFREELGGHGRAVLTATNRTEYAWEGKRLRLRAPQPSRFTGALIEGLRTGAADLNGDGRITVTELHEYVYESLQRAGVKQHPRLWADLEYQVTIARVVGAPFRHGPGTTSLGPSAETTADARGLAQKGFAESTDALFGAVNAPGTYTPVRRGRDELILLDLTLAETALGTLKDFSVATAVVCSACSGSGWGAAPTLCEACNGRGTKEKTQRSFLGRSAEELPCPACQGRGMTGSRCRECDGHGRVPVRRRLTVKIPAGAFDGMRIQFAGEGQVGPGGGEPGDVYIEVVELPHSTFQRRGDDLHCTVTIPRTMSITGGTTQLDTLDGTKTVRIPQGIRHGQTLRLAKLGATHLHTGGRGDILVRIEICD